MNVFGSVKKFSVGGMFIGAMILGGSLTLTGCLTDDKEEEPAVNTGTALTVEKTDTVWNLQGPNKGAYDLVTGEALSSSVAATNKDLVDMGVVQAAGVVWPKSLTSGNGTLFVKAASGFDYAGAKDSSLVKAYAAGTAAATTSALADGDVILAKLRGGSRYAAIKILAVVETSGDNRDYIRFGYRLTP